MKGLHLWKKRNPLKFPAYPNYSQRNLRKPHPNLSCPDIPVSLLPLQRLRHYRHRHPVLCQMWTLWNQTKLEPPRILQNYSLVMGGGDLARNCTVPTLDDFPYDGTDEEKNGIHKYKEYENVAF